MNANNILLHGIFSQNLGDDLFIKIILERYPQTRFVIYAPKVYKDTLGSFSNCIVVSDTDNVIRFLSRVCALLHLPLSSLLYLYLFVRYRINIFLIAGGSVFIEGNSHVPNLVINTQKLTKFILKKMKICIIGSNFGPYIKETFKQKVEKAIAKVDDICFRDIPSFETFNHLPNVRWGNDIVLNFIPYQLSITNNQPVVCVNIRSVEKWPSLKLNKERYLNCTKAIIERYQGQGYNVKLISFCERYGDDEITDELYSMLEDKAGVKLLYYKGNLEECMQAIASSEVMVATRFHAIILGLIYGVKLIPISYSIKTENMLKTFGLWKPIYDYNVYCNSSIDDVLDNAIIDYHIDTTNNCQFDYLDKLLK